MPSPTISFIRWLPTAVGGLWVGTNSGGLARYNPGRKNFTVYRHDPDDPTSISQGRIYALHIDQSGILWAGTLGGGLNKFVSGKEGFKTYRHQPGEGNSISSDNIYDITSDRRGHLWIRTEKNLNKYMPSEQRFESFEVPGKELVFEQTNSMYLDQRGILWIPYAGGLMKFNTRNEQSQRIELAAFRNNKITSICSHQEGQLWIGSYNGLFLFDRQDHSILKAYRPDPSNPGSIHDDMIITLKKDRTGSLWIGHGNTGMTKLNTGQKNFRHYHQQAEDERFIPGNIIRALMVDSRENIWIGTRNSGTAVLDGQSGDLRRFKPTPGDPEGMYAQRTTCFYEDRSGRIYMGSWGSGVRVVEVTERGIGRPRATGPTYRGPSENALRDSIVQAIYKDQDETLWVGLEAGLDLYNTQTGQYRHIRHIPDEPNSIAPGGVQSNCILEDHQGNFWIGTWGGLTMMKPKDPDKSTFKTAYRYQRFMASPDKANTLSDSRVISMHYNPENPNVLYAGTYGGGLNKITINYNQPAASHIKTYTTSDGLCNNVIYGILEDEAGHLWMSTNDGLARFNPRKETFTTFDAHDGLQSSQFRWGAYARGPGNELLFGGPNGFNAFQADQIKKDSTLPAVVITDFKISNQSLSAGDTLHGRVIMKKNINRTQQITLSYRENIFSFEFAGLHYAYPQDNQYRYQLKGFNDQWIQTGSDKRFATYTNLDPGTYTFQVKASNYDGVWNKQAARVKLEIEPPFWQTSWFYILVALVAGGLATAIIRLRIRATRREKERLQQRINEAVSEVEQQKEAAEASNQELKEKQREIELSNWHANSLATFGDILRQDKDNLEDFSYQIIRNLVKYSGAIAGALYLINEDEPNESEQTKGKQGESYIEMKACYAYDQRKRINKTIEPGEGMVGRSIKDHEPVYLTRLPENYLTISSGLGQTQPDSLMIVPLVTGEEVYGAFELARFGKFEQYIRNFLEDVAEDIAVTMKTTYINLRTNRLLEQSRAQYEELSNQKEELQQNVEELKATREEADRIKTEMEGLVEALKKTSYFVQFDKEGKVSEINDLYLQLSGNTSRNITGKSFTEFFHSMEITVNGYDEIWQSIMKGQAQKRLLKINHGDQIRTLVGTFIPIPNKQGDTEKVVQIATDITPYLNPEGEPSE